MGKKTKAPKAPDYASLANQDAAAQKKAAEYLTQSNRPTQVDRFGNTLSWSQDPSGNWTQTVALSDQQQQLQDKGLGMQGTGMDLASKISPFEYDQLQYSQGGRADIGFGNASVDQTGNTPVNRPPPMYNPASDPMNSGQSTNRSTSVAIGGKGGGGGGSSVAIGGKGGNLNDGRSGDSARNLLNTAAIQGDRDRAAREATAARTPTTRAPAVPVGERDLGYGATDQADPGWFLNQAGEIGEFDRAQGDRVSADLFEALMGRARPEQQRQQEGMDARLRNQGLQPGTEAYDRAMRNMMTAHGDATTQAGLTSTLAGYEEARNIYNTNLAGQGQRFDQQLGGWQGNLGRQNALENQSLGRASLAEQSASAAAGRATQMKMAQMQDQLGRAGLDQQGNIASENAALARAQQQAFEQNQRFNQGMQAYQMPYQQAQFMMQMGKQGLNPLDFQGFSGAAGYNPASMSNAAQNTYNANMGQYNAGQNMKGNILGAGSTLGAAALMSDAALKVDIAPISGKAALDTILSLGGYSYSWKSDGTPDMGLIAQQVQAAIPELTTRTEDGHLAVYYTGVVALAVEAIKYLAEELNNGD